MVMNLWRRIVWMLRRGSDERALAEEMEFHRAERQAALERSGIAADDARAQSRRAMGNVALAREEARAVWLALRIESVWHDAAYGLRLLRRAPAFALAMVTGVALGLRAPT